MIARLIVLNGPPASGKSTVAAAYASRRPLTLNLDIDIVRGMLGAWLEHASAAGLRARHLALGMARANLAAGDDVIVPQLLARPALVDQLHQLAEEMDAAFHEIALMASTSDVVSWFAARSADPRSTAHVDAQALADRLGRDALEQMCADLNELVASRPQTTIIPARVGGPDATLRELERVLGEPDLHS